MRKLPEQEKPRRCLKLRLNTSAVKKYRRGNGFIKSDIENGVHQLVKVALSGVVALFGTYQIAANGVAQSIWSLASILLWDLRWLPLIRHSSGSAWERGTLTLPASTSKSSTKSTGTVCPVELPDFRNHAADRPLLRHFIGDKRTCNLVGTYCRINACRI